MVTAIHNACPKCGSIAINVDGEVGTSYKRYLAKVNIKCSCGYEFTRAWRSVIAKNDIDNIDHYAEVIQQIHDSLARRGKLSTLEGIVATIANEKLGAAARIYHDKNTLGASNCDDEI